MAPKKRYVGPAGPVHKALTKDDLGLFHNSLTKICDLTSPFQETLQHLSNYLDGINTLGVLSTLIDPLKRDLRQCKAFFQSAEATAQSQKDLSASFIEEGRIQDALTALNTGHIAIMELTTRLQKLQDHLFDILDKAGVVARENLENHNWKEEVEIWKNSFEEWRALMNSPTWMGVMKTS